MRDLFEELFSEELEDESLACPYCKSVNTKYIDSIEDADPYNEDHFRGTEHTIIKNYSCKDCGCKFYSITKDIHYSGIEIKEDGQDELSVSVLLSNRWYNNNPDLYDTFEENGRSFTDYNETFEKLCDEFTNNCLSAGCSDAYADGDSIELEGPANVIRSLIRDGQDSSNDIEHTLYYVYQDYIDDVLPARIDFRNEYDPKVTY